MARLPRLVVPHLPHLLLQRACEGSHAFLTDDDYRCFLRCLRDAARLYHVAIHAYVLLPDRLQLLATPTDDHGLARMMQWAGRQYVPYFNARYQRRGALWQGRFRGAVLEADTFLLPACRHIELTPVRDGLVQEGHDWLWSSYRHHAGFEADGLITEHPLHWNLGNTPFEREAAYRMLLKEGGGADQLAVLDRAAETGWPLGSASFLQTLSRQTGRRSTPAPRGRPRKRTKTVREQVD